MKEREERINKLIEFMKTVGKLFDVGACKYPDFTLCNCDKTIKIHLTERQILKTNEDAEIWKLEELILLLKKKKTTNHKRKTKLKMIILGTLWQTQHECQCIYFLTVNYQIPPS